MLQRLGEVQRQHRRLQQESKSFRERYDEAWGGGSLSIALLLLLALLVPLPRLSHCLQTRVASAVEPECLEGSEAVGIKP